MGSVAAASETRTANPYRGAVPTAKPAPFSEWFPQFLLSEIRPYPGRGTLVLRYVLAATLTMLIITTFRIPGAAVGGFYSLSLPRRPVTGKARGALTLMLAVTLSLASVLLGGMIFANYPLTHFLWVVGSFFVGFFVLDVVTDQAAATAFVILMALTVPAWDVTVPTDVLVIGNLWTAGSIGIAALSTVAVETVFFFFQSKDPLQAGLEDRLGAVQTFLQQWANGSIQEATQKKIQQLAVVGVSQLRQIVFEGQFSPTERARRNTLVSLVGRLLDLAALVDDFGCSDADKDRLTKLAGQIGAVTLTKQESANALSSGETRREAQQVSLLDELEEVADFLHGSLSHKSGPWLHRQGPTPLPPPVFKGDRWTNPDHLHFALRGCLAATACYFFMNAVDWHGLGSSIFTVVVTATTSIGTSRQRQLLRFSGAMVGGLLFGVGAQILIIPWLDGIAGFTVLFVAVTTFAAWFITGSPRISYFGAQVGLAFYLIMLRIPRPETSFEPARDNLLGIMFGLIAMWVVFDGLGSKPAVVVMQEVFSDNTKLLVQFARHCSGDEKGKIDLAQVTALAEKIRSNFATVAAQGDAVLFESGPDRQHNLARRARLRRWEPPLRSFFLFELLILQYWGELSPQEVPGSVSQAYRTFNGEVIDILEQITIEGAGHSAETLTTRVNDAYAHLSDTICNSQGGEATARDRSMLWSAAHVARTLTLLAQR